MQEKVAIGKYFQTCLKTSNCRQSAGAHKDKTIELEIKLRQNESPKNAEKPKATCCKTKPDFDKLNQNITVSQSKHLVNRADWCAGWKVFKTLSYKSNGRGKAKSASEIHLAPQIFPSSFIHFLPKALLCSNKDCQSQI